MSKSHFIILSAAIGDSACTSQGGTCLNWLYYKCTAGYETGLCSGDSNNRCCLPCDSSCKLRFTVVLLNISKILKLLPIHLSGQILENSYADDDKKCTLIGGVCQDNSNKCDYSYQSGQCGGPSDRQCCVASASGKIHGLFA